MLEQAGVPTRFVPLPCIETRRVPGRHQDLRQPDRPVPARDLTHCSGAKSGQGLSLLAAVHDAVGRIMRPRSRKTTKRLESAVERRLHTRHRARTIVYITVPGGRRKLCKAQNLSATGVFIETSNLGLRKGQQVVLSFAINLDTSRNCIAAPPWSRMFRAAAPAS